MCACVEIIVFRQLNGTCQSNSITGREVYSHYNTISCRHNIMTHIKIHLKLTPILNTVCKHSNPIDLTSHKFTILGNQSGFDTQDESTVQPGKTKAFRIQLYP